MNISTLLAESAIYGIEQFVPRPYRSAIRVIGARREAVRRTRQGIELVFGFLSGGDSVPEDNDFYWDPSDDIFARDSDWAEFRNGPPIKMARTRGFSSSRRRSSSRRMRPTSKRRGVTKPQVKRMIMEQTLMQDIISYIQDITPILYQRNSSPGNTSTRLFRTESKSEIAIGSQTAQIGDRTGNTVTIKSVQLHWRFSLISGSTANIRVIVGLWFSDGVPLIENVLTTRTTDGTTQIANLDAAPLKSTTDPDAAAGTSEGRFRILADRMVTVAAGLSETVHRIQTFPQLRGHVVKYHDKTDLDESSGALWYILIHDSTVNAPSVHLTSKIKYSA